MPKPSTPNRYSKLTVLKLLLQDRSIAYTAGAADLTTGQVQAIADEHGYPDADKLRKAVVELSKPELSSGDETAPTAAVKGSNAAWPANDEEAKAAVDHIGQAAVIVRGRRSTSARLRKMAEQLSERLEQLREALDAEDAERRRKEEVERDRAAARAQVERLERELREAKARARGVGTTKATPSAVRVHDYDTREVRAWAQANGIDCPVQGRFLPRAVVDAWRARGGAA